ncbi:MAG: 1,4-dihydroxy-2-naphthoate octaprenyltransferase [Phycisphaerae bacterium]
MAKNKFALWLKELRLQFCVASVMPVLIGSALAYKQIGSINYTLAILAVLATVAFQIASNIANDYFDNRSRNDVLNENRTPFSGGSGLLQKGLITPKHTLIASLLFFAIGAILGIAILIITKKPAVLALGLAGLLGGFFYTAPPLKLGYRTAGEIIIALLFGVLPVYGAYYIQTGVWDLIPLLPASVVAVLIFLVIFANEFPDFQADKAVNKRTLVVTLGIKKAALLYKAALSILMLLLLLFLIQQPFVGMLFYLIILILSSKCYKTSDTEKLSQIGNADLSKATILLHTIGGIALFVAILVEF